MGTKKCKIDNAEIANFITNITSSFEGQRNTLNFMKKLGNVDANEVIQHAAEKEIYFVIDRMTALYKMEQEEAPLSETTTSCVNEFMLFLYNEALGDLDGLKYDFSTLKKELDDTYHKCA